MYLYVNPLTKAMKLDADFGIQTLAEAGLIGVQYHVTEDGVMKTLEMVDINCGDTNCNCMFNHDVFHGILMDESWKLSRKWLRS